MSKSALPVLAALALGIAAGFGMSTLRAPETQKIESAGLPDPAAPGNVAERARAILAISDPARRIIDLTALLVSVGPEALPALREAIDSAALDSGDAELGLFALWWSRFDPEAARKWIRTDTRAQFGSVIAAAFRGWAQNDPEVALEQAMQTRFLVQRQLAIEAALSGWDESGRPGLNEAVQKLARGSDLWIADVLAHRRVGTLGPEAALRWLDSLEDPAFRDTMVLPIAGAAAAVPGGGAVVAKWAEPRITGVDHRTRLPVQIGMQWIRHDPKAAMAWLAALPAGVDRDDGVESSFGAWARVDGVAAFAWAERLELDRWNEPAYAAYAQAMVVYDRAKDVLPVVARFSNAALRDSTMIAVVKAWLENDRPAALAWLAESNLPEGVRRELREAVRANRLAAPGPNAKASPPAPLP